MCIQKLPCFVVFQARLKFPFCPLIIASIFAGYVTQLHHPLKHIHNISDGHNSFKKPFTFHYCRFFNSLADNFRNSSKAETTRTWKLLRRSFFPKYGYSPKPKDENLETIQSGLCKQWNAFYRFSRPHTVIGTVSPSFSSLNLSWLIHFAPLHF